MTDAPDLIVIGRIATLGGDRGPAWVEALAIREGRVVAAGTRGSIASLAGPLTRRVELAPDEAAIPGLTDAHLHLATAAMARRAVDLAGVASIEEFVERVRGYASAQPDRDAWIEGGGWDADALGRWPTAHDLERAAPGRRIAIWAHDHHALLASSRALGQAGISQGVDDPDGGLIRRDEAGRAAGVLHEAAASLVGKLIPPADEVAIGAAIDALAAELVGLGVVAVHDPGGLAPSAGLGGPIAAYRAMAEAGQLRVRVHACLRPEQLDAAVAAGLRSGSPFGPDPLDRLRLGWLKTFADGSLGSRTAALLHPLGVIPGEPDPPNGGYGVWLTPPEELRAQADRAAAAGIATQIHGIGDAAVRVALDALAPTAGATPLMPRVEHAQLVSLADIPRFAALGVAASMQPVHVRSAPDWAAGTAAFGPGNALDLWASLRAWCVGPATTAGERDRGRLIAGQRADIVVLPAAALAEPVEVGGALWGARPRLVLMDGLVVAEA